MRIIISLMVLLTLLISCENDIISETEQPEPLASEVHSQQLYKNHPWCSAGERTSTYMAESAEYRNARNSLENFISAEMERSDFSLMRKRGKPEVRIPVVVNVLWHKKVQRVNRVRIDAQIKTLNASFNRSDPNAVNNIPKDFEDVVGKPRFVFYVAKVNYRRGRAIWYNNDMKYASKGGIDPTLKNTHLNIWICPTIDNPLLLGYTYMPPVRKVEYHGIVIKTKAFGGGKKTLVHEMGHWAGLKHIWGANDANKVSCTDSDKVADTPNQNVAYFGTPFYPQYSCGSKDMFMNYMDYVSDPAMFMFTKGQSKRMRSIFFGDGVYARYNENS